MELYYAYLRLLIAFPLIIALIYFGLRFLLPYCTPAFGGGARRIKVVERAALNNRAFLYIVKVDDQYLLLAATINSVTLLKELGEKKEASLAEALPRAQISSEPFSFAAVLQGLREKSKSLFRGTAGRKIIQKVMTSNDKKGEEKRK